MTGRSSLTMPSGLVTFVMTDIEGSTRLMRKLGDEYLAVLDRHNDLLRAAWVEHGGYEVNTGGDGFLVAFDDATDAVAACADGQRVLGVEPWPHDAGVRVRMGLHTGFAAPHGHDYIAMAVQLTARVTDAAHGGQVLLTPDVIDALDGRSVQGIISLGRFRVRDFEKPVELWQVGTDELIAPRVPPADRHNLLKPVGGFFGRASEQSELVALVSPGRVVTMLGPGGVGKTRMAIEFGLSVVDTWPDGVWFIDLARVTDGSLVVRELTQTLGVTVASESDPLECLLEELATKRLLLILDNAEHVREATAHLAAVLLQRVAGIAVLVTSREILGLRSESILRLGPLAFDRLDTASSPPVQLFCERAASVAPEWNPTEKDLDFVTDLCRRLDGLPLGIQMAAARTSGFTPSEILAALESHAGQLGTNDPSVELRHRSLDELISWSEHMLSPDERALFRALGVFAGTFSCEVVGAAVYGQVPGDLVPDIVWSLTNKSLVNVEQAAGATRYRLLETVRAYVRRWLGDVEHTETIRRLAAWYLDRVGPDVPVDRRWSALMADEIDNVRGLIPLLGRVDEPAAQRLAWSIATYLDLTQPYGQAIDEVERYATMLVGPSPERVGLLIRLADLRLRIGDVERAEALLLEAAEMQDDVGGAPWDDVSVERTRGELAVRQGHFTVARTIAINALEMQPSVRGRARMLNLLGISTVMSGDLETAIAAFQGEAELWGDLGVEALQLSAFGNVAEAYARRADTSAAAVNQLKCLELAVQYGHPIMIAYSAIMAARLSAAQGRWADAVRLQQAADRELSRIGGVMFTSDREESDAVLTRAVQALGPADFAAIGEEKISHADMLVATTDALTRCVATGSESDLGQIEPLSQL